MDWLLIQYSLSLLPLGGPWFAIDNLSLQCFKRQKFTAAYREGRTEPACLCAWLTDTSN